MFKYIQDKGYQVIEANKPFSTAFSVAAPEWQLNNNKYELLKELHQLDHIMLIPQGENRFLLTLETYLKKKKHFITSELGGQKIENSATI